MPVSLERRDLALSCGDWGRFAHAENLLSQSRHFYLGREQADALISAMEKQIKATWYEPHAAQASLKGTAIDLGRVGIMFSDSAYLDLHDLNIDLR